MTAIFIYPVVCQKRFTLQFLQPNPTNLHKYTQSEKCQ